MDYVVHVGDRQDLPRISGDGARPVENSLVEVRSEEFFFVADDIGKANHAVAHRNPQIGRRKEPGGARPRFGRAPRSTVKERDGTLPRQAYPPGSR